MKTIRIVASSVIGLGLIAGVGGFAGCGIQAKSAGGERAGVGAQGAFVPVRVTVHPLSSVRVDPETGARQIEAHIELFDRWDHPVKGLGTAVFELKREVGVGSAGDIGAQASSWDYDMTDPDLNARAYDPVTRTYRFLLNDGGDVLGSGSREWTLGVLFTRPDGVSLGATGRLRSGSGSEG